MSREAHVRFCESAGVRFPRATRLIILGRRHLANVLQVHTRDYFTSQDRIRGLVNEYQFRCRPRSSAKVPPSSPLPVVFTTTTVWPRNAPDRLSGHYSQFEHSCLGVRVVAGHKCRQRLISEASRTHVLRKYCVESLN